MDAQKHIEILQINLKENDRKMPPDVQAALAFAIGACYHIKFEHGGILPAPAAVPVPVDPQDPS